MKPSPDRADPSPNPYDSVAYPGRLFADTHPDRLAAIAVLHGMTPADVASCSVLELGAGDGTNLIGMAMSLPGARFTGVDLAERPVERGRAAARDLGLGNVDLRVMDVREAPADLGTFDYVIAHGLWSWVPPEARTATLAVIGRHLAPQGVAFVSYLAYPGSHLRLLLRDMLHFHGRDAGTPEERVASAREMAALLTAAPKDASGRRAFPRLLADDLSELDDGVLYHDWLAEVNAPASVTDFVTAADEQGLAFLGEAEFTASRYEHDPDLATARDTLRRLEEESVVLKEQYLDFLTCRGFRQTLLCRGDAGHDPKARAERMRGLAVASALTVDDDRADLAPARRVSFRTPKGRTLETDHPLAKAALLCLGQAWPGWVAFDQLLERSAAALGSGAAGESQVAALSQILFQALGAGYLEVHTAPVPFTTESGERPVAGTLARRAAATGALLPNLRHEYVRVDDALSRALIRVLDGSRDRAALIDHLAAVIARGEGTLRHEGRKVTDPAEARRRLADGLGRSLRQLARLALLEA